MTADTKLKTTQPEGTSLHQVMLKGIPSSIMTDVILWAMLERAKLSNHVSDLNIESARDLLLVFSTYDGAQAGVKYFNGREVCGSKICAAYVPFLQKVLRVRNLKSKPSHWSTYRTATKENPGPIENICGHHESEHERPAVQSFEDHAAPRAAQTVVSPRSMEVSFAKTCPDQMQPKAKVDSRLWHN